MDMMGKAMFSHHVNKLKGDIGFGDDEKEESNYDPEKEAADEAKLAEKRAKRKEEHSKRQAERAAHRNQIREKYGLKQNKHDQSLTTEQVKGGTAAEPSGHRSSLTRRSSSAEKSSAEKTSAEKTSAEKKEEKCSVM